VAANLIVIYLIHKPVSRLPNLFGQKEPASSHNPQTNKILSERMKSHFISALTLAVMTASQVEAFWGTGHLLGKYQLD
jgi:hypothetical protein